MRHFKLTAISLLIIILAAGFISAKSGPRVTVFYVSGTVECLVPGAQEWKKVRRGMFLYSGDSIKTYKNSFVEIAFDNKKSNIINLKPESHVVLKLGDREKVELIDGEVFSLVKRLPRGSHFEIRTPTAVCGARGTGWGTKANKAKTVVSAYEDNSYASGIKKDGTTMEDETVVREGYETIVKRFGRPSKLMKISDRDFEKWHAWKDALLERLSGRRVIRGRLAMDLDKIQDQKERIEERRDEDRIRKRTEETEAGGGTERGITSH